MRQNRIWILGAPDPEMELIEELLRKCGETVVYATDESGRRVHPGNAYRCPVPEVPEDSTVYAVECIGELPEGWIRIDHHRPGDPGYGRSPDEFLPASSIGQVIAELATMRWWREETPEGNVYFPWEIPIEPAGWRTLPGGSHHDHDSKWGIDEVGEYTVDAYGESGDALVKEMVEEGGYYHVPSIGWVYVASRGGFELGGSVDAIVIPNHFVLCAASDHCLAAAYRGECSGVDPDALMDWRIETRAAFQERPASEILADINRACMVLREAPSIDIGGYAVRDLRDRVVPELPEAALREEAAYLTLVTDRDGRRKVVLGGRTFSKMVKAFMAEWAPAHGLVDIYGDPARGFAGGYLPSTKT